VAKSAEIKLLREHLQREENAQLSRTNSICSISGNGCVECKGKDTRIQELMDNHSKEMARLSTLQEQSQMVHNKLEFSMINAELQALKQAHQELKARVEQSQQQSKANATERDFLAESQREIQ
jgi:UDP-N-acetylglucosamine transferase subunit ALG13